MICKEAREQNEILKAHSPVAYCLLSEKGRRAYFPGLGILAQTQEAKSTKNNATIGEAYEESGEAMVLESLSEQISLPKKSFLYAGSYGNKELRELWLKEIREKNPSLKGTISLPVCCAGLTHALFVAGRLFVDEKETMILPDLYWNNYELTYDCKFAFFKTFNEGFNVSGLQKKLMEREEKKILLLNFPNNPSGYTPLYEEAKEIAKAIEKAGKAGKKMIIILDDAYFGLVYEKGVFLESLFSLLCDLHENVLVVKVDGVSKELYAWGLRIAFITFGSKSLTKDTAGVLEDKAAGLIRATVSNAPNISECMILNSLKDPQNKKQRADKLSSLKQRYVTVKEALKVQKYKKHFEALPYNSGYFMCVQLKRHDANPIRKRLIEKYDTGVIAVGKDILRIAYSSISKEKIPLVFENIYNACEE